MTVKFEADPASREELEAVIATATFLRDRIGGDEPGLVSRSTTPSPAALADQLVVDLKGRIGTKLTDMLVAEAKLSEKGDYTMAELANEISQTTDQVRSHRGNLGRSMVRARRAVPGAPEVHTWDGKRCRVPEPTRSAILKHLA